MRLVLLTTDTIHHLYFARKVQEQFPWEAIILENREMVAPFETFHPFETARDAYEHEVLQNEDPKNFMGLASTHWHFRSVNEEAAVFALKALNPEVVIVFGTGRLLPEVINIPTIACLNLHGGNPEEYRGLDSHLWAIYHRDFANLITTLHRVNASLDTGDIVLQSLLPLTKGMQLAQLRTVSTRVCVDMVLLALLRLHAHGSLASCPQTRRGRYYSFMPAMLKEDCVRKFHQYVSSL